MGAAPRITPVTTSNTTYEVRTGVGLLASLGSDVAKALGRTPHRVMLVHDDALRDDLVRGVAASLTQAGSQVHSTSAHADEREKSLPTVHRLLTACAEAGLDRGDLVVALGGGLVGDVAGFVAASYMRGVPVIQCPTTLLAAVDASVGGKTGVNIEATVEGRPRLLKNLAGAFHQPLLVVADVRTFDSLDDRQYISGLAECVKHAMISADWGDAGLLDWTLRHADALVARDDDALLTLIERNVAVKARVVEADERELAGPGAAGRMLLNLGHTFGHAIETLDGLQLSDGRSGLLHGEAVSLGLCCACACAAAAGTFDGGDVIRSLLLQLGLPARVAGLPSTSAIIAAMSRDKKAAAGAIRLVLPTGPGRAEVVEGTDEAAIAVAIDSIRAIDES